MTSPSLQTWRHEYAPDVLGDSAAVLRALDKARRAADHHDCVLMVGEAGTGAALFARAIHRASPRAAGPFVVINCAAMPDELIEAELFGSQRGHRVGRVATGHGGTVLFDEIADLPLVAQVKLLRVIDQGVLCPLGGKVDEHVDVRVIAATRHDLPARAAAGSFRADLLRRIAAHRFRLPPLRERGDDVCALAEAMLRDPAARHGVRALDDGARLALLAHPWHDNLPELHAAIERGLRHATGPVLTADDLDLDRHRPLGAGSDPALPAITDDRDGSADALERRLIDQALRRARGDRREAARRLGIRPTALIAKLKPRPR